MEIMKIIVRLISIVVAIWLYVSGWYTFVNPDDENGKFKFLKIYEWLSREFFIYIWFWVNILIVGGIFVWAWV